MPQGNGTGPTGQRPHDGRGKGQGYGGSGQGGPGGECVCPACGTTMPHQQGTPCTNQTCPKCGARMTRRRTQTPAELIVETGADVVLCGGLGVSAVHLFEDHGMHVYTDASGTVAEALQAHKAGRLCEATDAAARRARARCADETRTR